MSAEPAEKPVAPPIELEGVRLTEAQLRRRRARSIAIGLALGALVILFWAVTIVRMGGNVLNRTL